MDKSEFLALSKRFASQYGLMNNDFVAMKSVGYFQSMLNELHDNSYMKAEENVRERHLITAEKKISLLKEGYATDGVLFSNFATPCNAKFMLVLPISEILNVDTKDDYVDANGATHKVFKKATSYIKLTDFPYSFLYDFEVVLTPCVATPSYPYPYKVRANYISIDKYHPLDSDNTMDKPINAFYVVSNDVLSDMGNKECVALVVDLLQIETIVTDNKYYLTDNESSIKSVTYPDMLVEFAAFYKEINDTTFRCINKAASYNKISVSEETIFYKIVDDNKFMVINRSYGNFTPANNSTLRIESYVTKGSAGIFTYTGNDINFLTEDGIASKVYLMSNPTNGADTPTLEELRNKMILNNSVVGTINNNRDFKKYLATTANTSYLNMEKSRHDNIEMCNDVTVYLKSTDGDIIPTNTLDVDVDLTQETQSEDGSYYTINSTIRSYKYGYGYNREMTSDTSVTVHNFITPFVMVYNPSTNVTYPYNRLMNDVYQLSFDYCDKDSDMFTIINRLYLRKHPNATPYLGFNLMTSTGVTGNGELHTFDEITGMIDDNDKIRVYAVLYAHNAVIGYAKCVMEGYSESEFYYRYVLSDFIKTSYPDGEDITVGLKRIKYGDDEEFIIPYDDIKVELLCYLKDDTVIENTIPNNTGYRLVNKFSASDIKLFSEVSNLHKISVKNVSETNIVLKQIPLVQEDYYKVKFMDVHNEIDKHHVSFADLTERFYENTSVRLRFANSYGYSKRYKIGSDKQVLDNIALSMLFYVKFTSDTTITVDDVKTSIIQYIQSLDFKNGARFHVSKVIDHIINLYPAGVDYIEFDNINDYPSKYQLITLDDDVTGDTTDTSVYEIVTPRISLDYTTMTLGYDVDVVSL